ncbi:MAG: DNA-formamidopyrimidine glycosylase family protein [Ornithinimicrobium sp.]
MPELPEVESARATIEQSALHRRISDVDDTDTWVCRPHASGDLRAALVGRELTGAFRQGKSMWCETSAVQGDHARHHEAGPDLGIHLGMSGRIVVSDVGGDTTEGGDWQGGRYGKGAQAVDRKPEWDRFTLTFADGGTLRLFDKRRLGRVRLDPPLDALGPDAEQVSKSDFAERVGRGRAPVKARLLDQSVVAGVGNLLADETLWQAKIAPTRRVDELSTDELGHLHTALRTATTAAIRHGGVHTGDVIGYRKAGARCPRCDAEMRRDTVAGRTTWWCSQEQGG